ncbi:MULTISPECIES: hypothetical protein [unclassified Herbaspirillum]|uniref:hypothetical protein n=1 Tax=unclassified Herbaspirillum TaxID=2624150 RepID=UPI000C093783|nr:MULTISPECIES: hypothetical protein [unclassified Herbaspirillum]MAF05933.1 hypothetical protein [Herbaspirillum sp.]MBO17893.1 hypothetical protein [Herbaspirillum sp.]|tara:strand:- start:537 stop:770 length:234 start_codon:yes stop_codon:yes gene_type:complete
MNYRDFTDEELQNAMRITQIELRETASSMNSALLKSNAEWQRYDRIVQSCMESTDEMVAEVLRRSGIILNAGNSNAK